MASEDVLERADRWCKLTRWPSDDPAVYRLDAVGIIRALAAEIERLRAKLDSEASHRLSLCADNERFVAENAELRKARERAKPEIEKAVELIQRWGCECEPQIGFTCGPCRVVEIIDAAMGWERTDGE